MRQSLWSENSPQKLQHWNASKEASFENRVEYRSKSLNFVAFRAQIEHKTWLPNDHLVENISLIDQKRSERRDASSKFLIFLIKLELVFDQLVDE